MVHEVHPWVVEDTTKVATEEEVGIKVVVATTAGEDSSRVMEVGIKVVMAMAVGVKTGEAIPEEDTKIKADGEMTITGRRAEAEIITALPKIKAAAEAMETTAKIKAAMEADQEVVVRWEAAMTKDTEVKLLTTYSAVCTIK